MSIILKTGVKKVAVATIASVIEFIQAVAKFPSSGGKMNVFRGQRNDEWPTTPAIFRSKGKLLEHERELIRELISVHPQEFKDDTGMFDRLVRMQHFGLPTRLLDVTINPLVALYFATEPYRSQIKEINGEVILYQIPKQRRKYYDSDAVSCISNLANLSNDERSEIIANRSLDRVEFNGLPSVDRLTQFIRSEKPHFRPDISVADIFRPYFVVPKMNNRRIIAQSGAFIIYGLEDFSSPRVRARYPIVPQRIMIPQDAKSSIRQELEQLGINESTLFPELDRAASYIVRRFS